MNAIHAASIEPPERVKRDEPAMLDKATYVAIRSSLAFEPSPLAVIGILSLNVSLCALALWLLSLGTTPAYLLSQLIFPIVFFQAFSILHECGHGSCTSRSWLNTLIGHCMSPLCFLPYFPWKFQHALHHAWSGNLDKDPSLTLLRGWRAGQRLPLLLRVAWRSWIPVASAMTHVVFWTYPITVWRKGPASQLGRCIASVVWMLGVYAGAHYAWPELFSFGNFALAFVIYLVAAELVNMPHHAGQPTVEGKLALWEQGYSTRSCYYPRLVSELLVLNFNFHVEHHLFPTLPWYRLRQARALIKPALGAGYNEAIGVQWNLENRSRDITHVLRAHEPPASEVREP
jgi:omega-6 fatty acid desaturase (delta-12 desaturase)